MISPANLAFFKTTMNLLAGQAFSSTPTHYQRIATDVPMGDAAQLVIGWTGMLPKPRLWTGSRVVVEPAAETYVITPKPWELTVELDRFELDDTKGTGGIYYRTLPDMARQSARQPDYWMRDLVEGIGDFSSTADQLSMDGISHWNTGHPVDVYTAAAGTYCNDFGTGGQTISIGGVNVLVGGALGLTSIATIREYQGTLKAQDGEPMGIVPDVLMHHSMQEMEVTTLLTALYFSPPSYGTFTGQVGAVDNPGRRFGLEPLKNELLTKSGGFYMLDTTKAFKPFLHVIREPWRMTPRISENDPNVFDRHAFLWGGWGRIGEGFGFPWLSARSGI
jgi:phage major head subunit gpT-like protein